MECEECAEDVFLRILLHLWAVFLADFTRAHLARCAVAIFFRGAADIRLLFIETTFADLPAFSLTLAHRALWAAAMRARAAAESLPLPGPFLYVLPKAVSAALIPRSSFVIRSCSLFKR